MDEALQAMDKWVGLEGLIGWSFGWDWGWQHLKLLLPLLFAWL